jgi:hypothetical protein
MQIGGWIDLTSSNTDEVIYLLAAYVDGRRSDIFMDVAVKPNIVCACDRRPRRRERAATLLLPRR